MYERIEEGNGASLKEILDSECIPEDMYLQALKMTQRNKRYEISYWKGILTTAKQQL